MSDQNLQNEGPAPEFSQELHDRIMSRIAASSMSGAYPSRRYRRLLPATLAATMILVLTVFVGINRVERAGQTPPQMAGSGPTVRYPSFGLHVPAICQMTVNHYADVDHQSELVLGYLTRQLDVLPAYRPNPGSTQHS